MSAESEYAEWVAVDWGTSNVRAWAMQGGAPVAEAKSDAGMGGLERNQFDRRCCR